MEENIFKCDWEGTCNKKPYCEVYNINDNSWSYLCRWHYYHDLIRNKFRKENKRGYYILKKEDVEKKGVYDDDCL